MKSFYVFVLLFCNLLLHAESPQRDESIVCLHGLMGAPWNMYYIANGLEADGWRVNVWGYESREKGIEEHAVALVGELKQIAHHHPGRPIHFVAHSMGSLVLRSALNHKECPKEAKIGRAVLLTPPNQGSVVARSIGQCKLGELLLKDKSGKELALASDFEYLGCFPEAMPILVIAGDLGVNPFISGKNDGTVSVDETYLSTPHQHIVITSGHKSILFNREARKLAKHFILGDLEVKSGESSQGGSLGLLEEDRAK